MQKEITKLQLIDRGTKVIGSARGTIALDQESYISDDGCTYEALGHLIADPDQQCHVFWAVRDCYRPENDARVECADEGDMCDWGWPDYILWQSAAPEAAEVSQ